MNGYARTLLVGLALALALASAGCDREATTPEDGGSPNESAPTTDGGSPKEGDGGGLYQEITQDDYASWQTAPGYATPQPAQGPHGDETRIFLGPSAEAALSEGKPEWPVGAVIVKQVYVGGEIVQLAAMKKTDEGWYWGEWDTDGEAVVEGLEVQPCQGCHERGTDGTLAVTLK